MMWQKVSVIDTDPNYFGAYEKPVANSAYTIHMILYSLNNITFFMSLALVNAHINNETTQKIGI